MIPAVLPTYARYDVAFERGEGAELFATDGRRYLDFGAGIAVCGLGHARMRGFVTVQTAEEFQKWMTDAIAEAAAAASDPFR